MGFPFSFLVSTLNAPPGTQAHRQCGGPEADPKSERKAASPEAREWFNLATRRVFVCGLAALPARADVMTSSREIQADFRALQLNKSNFSHLHYFSCWDDVIVSHTFHYVELKNKLNSLKMSRTLGTMKRISCHKGGAGLHLSTRYLNDWCWGTVKHFRKTTSGLITA